MQARQVLGGGAALLAAAGIAVTQRDCQWPSPSPSPSPTAWPSPSPAPPPDCLPGVPWCFETGQVCSSPEAPCKHNPTQDPAHCELAPACPAPDPTPAPTPTPGPAGACPKPLKDGSRVYMASKAYGQGWDSTVRVYGDPGFCFAIHGEMVNDCHLEGWAGPSGNDPTARWRCEVQLIGGCPVWQFSSDQAHVLKCSNDPGKPGSCDHFGDPVYRDDPQTPTTGDSLETLQGFEGKPLVCGLQRDAYGPMAGYFTVAHGKGFIRACRPDWQECSSWKPFDK